MDEKCPIHDISASRESVRYLSTNIRQSTVLYDSLERYLTGYGARGLPVINYDLLNLAQFLL